MCDCVCVCVSQAFQSIAKCIAALMVSLPVSDTADIAQFVSDIQVGGGKLPNTTVIIFAFDRRRPVSGIKLVLALKSELWSGLVLTNIIQ